jgi:hypothetical protein
MSNKSAILCGVSTLALAATLSSLALADTTPPSTSTTPTTPASDKITTSAAATVGSGPEANNLSQTALGDNLMQTLHDKVEFAYFGVYRGGAVGDPGNSYQPDINGNAGPDAGAQSLENYVTLGYKPAKDWMVGIVSHFFYNGAAAPDQNGTGEQLNAGFQVMNPQFVISKAKLIDRGELKVKGYLYAEIPVTHYDYIGQTGHDMATSIAPTANITYDFRDSRFSVGTYTYIRGYVPGSSSPDDLRTYRFVAAPYGNYQITPTVAATMWVDLIDIRRHGGSPFFSAYGMVSEEGDIEPGINWDVVPGKLSVNPILNIYTGNPTLASTSFQAVIIGHAW